MDHNVLQQQKWFAFENTSIIARKAADFICFSHIAANRNFSGGRTWEKAMTAQDCVLKNALKTGTLYTLQIADKRFSLPGEKKTELPLMLISFQIAL